jgi:hypothetical protein
MKRWQQGRKYARTIGEIVDWVLKLTISRTE